MPHNLTQLSGCIDTSTSALIVLTVHGAQASTSAKASYTHAGRVEPKKAGVSCSPDQLRNNATRVWPTHTYYVNLYNVLHLPSTLKLQKRKTCDLH